MIIASINLQLVDNRPPHPKLVDYSTNPPYIRLIPTSGLKHENTVVRVDTTTTAPSAATPTSASGSGGGVGAGLAGLAGVAARALGGGGVTQQATPQAHSHGQYPHTPCKA